jgi:hypothetical protein
MQAFGVTKQQPIRPEGRHNDDTVAASCCLVALAGLAVLVAGLLVIGAARDWGRASEVNLTLARRGILTMTAGIIIIPSAWMLASLCRCRN